jgi:hypothetical protein
MKYTGISGVVGKLDHNIQILDKVLTPELNRIWCHSTQL